MLLPVVFILADVNSNIVADVIATFFIMCWQMLLPGGRWNSHCRVVD